MLSSVLIANRGEIACRIIRTARQLDIRTVAVYSQADREAPFVGMADEAYEIGPAPARESYLSIERILDVARKTRIEAIHPGYGFLSEKAEFAQACTDEGIVFVGPPASAIRAMGLKDAAKTIVQKAGVPIVPGYHGTRQEPDFLRQKAYEIGYPVLIKAVAGGGGKGMRRVDKAAEFEAALMSAEREAENAFGDPRVLIERLVLSPRHIEVQIFADQHGNIVHLFERDCSLQRRHQKVIEEAPAPGLSEEMRTVMGKAAVEAARAVGYVGAGTVEFIADGRGGLSPDRFYFMEMNTRLQVEHPVTEAITGLDLVALQFRVASGEALGFSQSDLHIDGHAVEARLYAEDPERDFLPSTGKLVDLKFPSGEGIRVDSGVAKGNEVSPYYDPMIAKIIAHGATRKEALDRLAGALAKTIVAGPRSNLAFLQKLCSAADFRREKFDTGFIDSHLRELGAYAQPRDDEAVCDIADLLISDAEKACSQRGHSAWEKMDAFQLGAGRESKIPLLVDGERVEVILTYPKGVRRVEPVKGKRSARKEEERTLVFRTERGALGLRGGRQTRVEFFNPFDVDLDHLETGGVIKSPMHGKLISLFADVGARVKKNDKLAIVEAMKMEHVLVASADGEILEISAKLGAQVEEGQKLIFLKPEEGSSP